MIGQRLEPDRQLAVAIVQEIKLEPNGRVQFDDLRITEEVIGAETKEEAGALVGA